VASIPPDIQQDPFMNIQAKSKKVNYKQWVIIGLVALAAIYHFSRPTLERVLNTQLPSLNQNDGERSNNGEDAAKAVREWLTSVGSKRYKSPAGLVYTPSRREHRIEHVLLHCKDNPSKHAHGIFTADGVEVFKLIDEAYELAKSNSNRVKKEKSRGNQNYIVAMNRKVGYDGGAKGKRNGGRELKRLKLVLDDDRVITAFPTR